MKVTVWGCRGSLPAPGPEKDFYGGNTSCVQVLHKNTCIILDGGSGIQRLGAFLKNDYQVIHIMLSHLHIDHTMGLGFFLPLYNPNITVHIWGPATSEEPLLERLRRYFSPPLFPVRLSELPKPPVIHEIHNSEFQIDEITINTNYVCHPGPTLGFRLTCGNSVFAYMPDHEIALGSANFPHEPEWTSGFEIAQNADLLFHDAQYRETEYTDRVGWGHSAINDALTFADLCGVKRVALFHHDPAHSDAQLNQLFKEATAGKKLACNPEMCAEGNVYDLGS